MAFVENGSPTINQASDILITGCVLKALLQATGQTTTLPSVSPKITNWPRACQIDVLRESDAHFLMQQSFPNPSYKEWLLIDKQTGEFRYSRYWPEGASEPKWFDPHH